MSSIQTLLRTISLGMLAGMLVAAAKLAVAAELRQPVTVDGAVVTLGDLFDAAGAVADVVVDEAPAPGERELLLPHRVRDLALAHGIDWQIPRALKRIAVTRSGAVLSQAEITGRISAALQARGFGGGFAVSLFDRRTVFIPVAAAASDVTLGELSYDPGTGRFEGTLSLPDGWYRRVAGKAVKTVGIPVLAQVVRRGEIISADDVVWLAQPENRVGETVIRSKAALIGQAAKRQLSPGRPLRANDVHRPYDVKKGALVTMVVAHGNLTLTATGRALQSGREGDVVRLVNDSSHRTVEGRVSGPDTVEIQSRGRIAQAAR